MIFNLLFHLPTSNGQFLLPISSDSNITTLRSPVNGNITIRFKSPPAGTCTTAFPTQRQYTGYVSLPPFALAPIQQNYSINTFFWFIEARTNSSTAPLTVYINGGPGSSSLVGLYQENGPCRVVEVDQDKLGTQPNEWGWDRSSNILYVDQPNQVGFSYDTPTNGSLNLITSTITEPPSDVPSGQPDYTFLNGTFSSNNSSLTANTTEIAAHAIWHMLQGFLGAFPQYNPGTYPHSTKPAAVGVNLFDENYLGKYGPAFARFWEQQNLLRRNGSISSNKTLDIRLSSLGVMQGCVDDSVQGRFYPIFANNNTYGIQALSLTDQQAAASSFLSANGCQQQIINCKNAVVAQDPQNDGDVASVSQICANAQHTCNNEVFGPYYSSGRNIYDITHNTPDPFPSSLYLEYLNNADVQAAIGVPINYTQTTTAVANAFLRTGDYERGDHIGEMAYLLSLGVRVALVYGDRDYSCNWLGGEAVSFSIAAQAAGYSPFYSAGYADIVVNTSYIGGAVRQYGNLSFSRIYDAGHLIPAYQPETAFTVFTRIIMGNDVSLGAAADLSTYKSNGTVNATETSKAPSLSQPEPTCWVRSVDLTCTSDLKAMLQKGHDVMINGVLYGEASDWQPPPSSISVIAGYPGTYPTSTTTRRPTSTEKGSSSSTTSAVLTGVFTATSTPSPTTSKGTASGDGEVGAGWILLGWLLAMGGVYIM